MIKLEELKALRTKIISTIMKYLFTVLSFMIFSNCSMGEEVSKLPIKNGVILTQERVAEFELDVIRISPVQERLDKVAAVSCIVVGSALLVLSSSSTQSFGGRPSSSGLELTLYNSTVAFGLGGAALIVYGIHLLDPGNPSKD
ncbi:MAG: hypothetical protein VW851_07195 [Cryomorphaceae bacterium]